MRTNLMFDIVRSQITGRSIFLNIAASLILSFAQPCLAQAQQKTFASVGQATEALYDAVRSKDDREVQVILGQSELTSTGNDAQDKLEREHFAQKYQEMHRLVREADGSTLLYIGAENWPFPIPLVAADGKWRFDSDSGSQEIVAREIGENESSAIEVCRTINRATASPQHKTDSNDPLVSFALNLIKSEYANSASSEPFHGYYFRVLERSHGATLVAYPLDYGSSGVMTFLLRGNAMYETDLGEQTATVAQAIQSKPKGKWKRMQ